MLVDICSDLEDSLIVGNSSNYLRTLRSWLSSVARSANSAWKLCWRGSVDGWAARTFHWRCNGKGPTVTIIRVGRYIFGGYTSVSWGKLTWLQKDIILLLAVTSGYQLWSRSLPLFTSVETTITWNNNSNGLVPVVKKLDSAINRINHYPADKHLMVSIGLTDRRDA